MVRLHREDLHCRRPPCWKGKPIARRHLLLMQCRQAAHAASQGGNAGEKQKNKKNSSNKRKQHRRKPVVTENKTKLKGRRRTEERNLFTSAVAFHELRIVPARDLGPRYAPPHRRAMLARAQRGKGAHESQQPSRASLLLRSEAGRKKRRGTRRSK